MEGNAGARTESAGNMTLVHRVGIIGCGRKASAIDDEHRWLTNYDALPCSHASAYSACPRTQIVAAADPDRRKLEAFGNRWSVSGLYADWRQMLAQEQPTIVSVITHAPLHAAATIDAARAGAKGIICEKAMAASLAEAGEMIAACAQAGARLLVNHPRRYHPTYPLAKAALDAGEIGELRAMSGLMFDALIHNGTHLFDMMRYFAGPAKWVSGCVVAGAGGDPGGFGAVGFERGVVGLVEVQSMQGFELTLLGTDGRITINSFEDGFQLWRYRDRRAGQQGAWFQYGAGKDADVERRRPAGPVKPPMLAAVEDLVESIERGRAPASSGEDGRAALETGLAFHKSSAAGMARVDLPLQDKELRVESR